MSTPPNRLSQTNSPYGGFAPDTKLTLTPTVSGSGLGPFTFSGLEIPAEISGIGTQQQIAVHKLIGGARQLDAMGVDYAPIVWSGLFFGQGATDRVDQLKALVGAGQPLTLAWHVFSYTVLIRSFEPDERRQYEISYHITCEVVVDNSNPDTSLAPITIDESVANSLGIAEGLTALLVAQAQAAYAQIISQIQTLVASVLTAVNAVQSIIASPASGIAAILIPLAAAQTLVSSLVTASDAAIALEPGFAGVIAGSDALTMATSLVVTEATMEQESLALSLAGCLGVLSSNLKSVNGSPNTLAVVGGSLFAIAAAQYGDPTLWTAIAAANGLTDPQITGPMILTIPLNPANAGGILNS